MKYLQLFETWLNDNREMIVPVPRDYPNWKLLDSNVTDDTKKLLDLLEPDFHDVALFSWHPNIEQAQYSDNKKYYRDGDSNYNKRLWIDGSLIALRREDKPKPTGEWPNNSNHGIVEKAMKQFPYIQTLGGSGDRMGERESVQVQLSFLTKNVGTHEEANDIKQNKITAGAYSFFDGRWNYIPAEKLDPTGPIKEKLESTAQLLKKIFENFPDVKKVFVMSWNPMNKTVRVELSQLNSKYNSYNIKVNCDNDLNLSYDLESTGPSIRITTLKNASLDKIFTSINLIPDEKSEALGKNPENYAEILKEYRGKVAGRNYNF